MMVPGGALLTFVVEIAGSGFCIQRDGRTFCGGFVVRRYVDASDHDQAQARAVQQLSAELKELGVSDAGAPPLLDVTAIERLAPGQLPPTEQPPLEWHEAV